MDHNDSLNSEDMEEEKLFKVGDSEECIWFKPSEVQEMIDDGYLKEVPEFEHKDISFLVEETYVNFFTTAIVEDDELPIMQSFREKVHRARGALTGFGKYKRVQPVWRDMCNRFYPGQNHVSPKEMIEHLYELDANEVVEFLWYVVAYCNRWCGGEYKKYTNVGLIGRLLVRLQDLPLTVE
jgi:hypothetical protein